MKEIDQNKSNHPNKHQQTWELMEGYGLSADDIDIDAAWSSFERKLDDESKSPLVLRRNPNYLKWSIAAAAALFVAISASFFLLSKQNQGNKYVNSSTIAKEYQLEDNSTITLNSNSNSTFSISDKKRTLVLDGSGKFKIQKNESKPFQIKAPDFTLVVLGTQFEITEETSRAIHVTEGHVKIRSKNSSEWLHLYKGESAKIDNGVASKFLDELVFDDVKMNIVISSLQNKFNKTIKVDRQLLNCTLTGDFSKSTIEEALKSISLLFKANLSQKNESTFLIQGGNCH